MPKMKTKSGAKKRFKVTASGKIKRAHSGKKPHLNKESKKEKEPFMFRCVRRFYAGKDDENFNLQQVIRSVNYAY